MTQIWKDIIGYEGQYQVSDDGAAAAGFSNMQIARYFNVTHQTVSRIKLNQLWV